MLIVVNTTWEYMEKNSGKTRAIRYMSYAVFLHTLKRVVYVKTTQILYISCAWFVRDIMNTGCPVICCNKGDPFETHL